MNQVISRAALDALRVRFRWRRIRALAENWDRWLDGNRVVHTRIRLQQTSHLLDALPPDQRAALVLKELEGMTSQAIAEVMKCSEGAVEQRLVQARAALRREEAARSRFDS